MDANVYTAVVAAPSSVTYSIGATFSGILASSSSAIIYTVGKAVADRSSLSLTVTLTNQKQQTIDASILLTSAGAVGPVTAQVAAPLTTSYALSNSGITSTSTNSLSSPQAITSSSTTQPTITTTSSTASSSLAVSSTTSSLAGASSSSANTSEASASQGHSTGELIGVAVGVLLAGALIAALITFMLMRRKNGKSSRRYDSVHGRSSLSPVAGEAMVIDGKSWQRHLPQSESDHSISRATTELFDQIELHVENFYTNRMIEMQSATIDRPTQLLHDAISSGLRPTSAIKYVMTTIVLSSIDFRGDTEHSLLPIDYNTVQIQSGYRKPGFDQAISQWRTLTAYLGSDTLQSETYLREREGKITAIANQLCRTFRPWLQGDNNSCHQSTNGILRRGSDLGITLFSQPASFAWDWGKDQQRREERRTVLPGLLKMTDETAQPLVKHVCLVRHRTET